jgi:hypothetical protein
MKKQNLFISLAFIAAVSVFFASCRKADATSSTAPEHITGKAIAQHNAEDHITMTPERTAIAAAFGKASRLTINAVYRGFTIKYVGKVSPDIMNVMKRQIDFIFVSGVKASTIANMQTTIINCGIIPGLQPNLFYNNGQVYITDLNAFAYYNNIGGPVIFHECMHYMHDRFTVNSFGNPTIDNYYNIAVVRDFYLPTDYVMFNSAEYFATTSEAWFNPGQTFRVPYNRAYINRRDAQFGNWLELSY